MAKRDLKYYYRLDNKLRPVPGTLIARYSIPVNGHWNELTGWGCCGQLPVTAVIDGDISRMAAGSTMTYTLMAGNVLQATATGVYQSSVALLVNQLVESLNNGYSTVATFTVLKNTIVAIPKPQQSSFNWTATQAIQLTT